MSGLPDTRASSGADCGARILFVEHSAEGSIGGSHHSLLYLIKHLDRERFVPVVAFYEKNGFSAMVDMDKAVETAVQRGGA